MACWGAEVFDIKPGLWDFSVTVQMSGMPPIPNLDQMTPEQRARIEGAMKNMGNQTHSSKSCVTREGIEKAIAESSNSQNNKCSPKIMNMSSSKVALHMECTQDRGTKTNGDITIDRKDGEHIVGIGTMKSTMANGRSMDVKWSLTGTFVASDCGNVKPSGQ